MNTIIPIDHASLPRDAAGRVLCACGAIMEALPECEGATWYVCGCGEAVAAVDMQEVRG